MLKNLFTLATIFLLISCSAKNKKTESAENDFKIEDQTSENATPYQTLENEQQAIELNKQAEAQIQEVEVQDRVFFGYDAFDLSDDAKKILDTQVSWLKSDAGIKVTIEGHTDERGTREYNLALGEKRANAAKNYLVQNGIDASRIKTVSFGKERPAYFGATDEIFAKNRRAVTVIN